MPVAYLVLLIAFALGLVGLGVYAILELPRLLKAGSVRGALTGPSPSPRPAIRTNSDQWRKGLDLLHYPQRLAELEVKLETSHMAVCDQIEHLRTQHDKVAAKGDRGELAARYDDDAQMLERRSERMQRVMGLVWRTRATLMLRAHIAITARHRPEVGSLPEGNIPSEQLERAAAVYQHAANSVRNFVREIAERQTDLNVTTPIASRVAQVTPEDRAAVDEEITRARTTYADLSSQMDRLADTLSYLSDRCRTRQVVAGAPIGVVAEPGSEGLVDEVNNALGSLNDLADLGNRHLADTAMDNLDENISQLERAGLEAQAEADAALEVARLLEQFPR